MYAFFLANDILSGTLVLSDGGVFCIDEFDKMSDSTRNVLHMKLWSVCNLSSVTSTDGTDRDNKLFR